MMRLRPLRLRLALWRLWHRHAWPFDHAHHPLCARFQHDVLHLGRLHLCRSCALLYATFILALTCLLSAGIDTQTRWVVFHILALFAIPLSHPRLYHGRPRWLKDILRSSAGLLGALLLTLLLQGPPAIPLAYAALLALVYRIYLLSYSHLKQRACDGCPELSHHRVCSGYALQADRIRQYEERATALVLLHDPPCLIERHAVPLDQQPIHATQSPAAH